MDSVVAICANCSKVFSIEELEEYHDFWSRVEVGNVIPAGDCPECQAFCYLDEGVGSSFRVKVGDESIQLLDRHGEIVSWHQDEWIEDPSVVFSIVNAILKGIFESPAAVRALINQDKGDH